MGKQDEKVKTQTCTSATPRRSSLSLSRLHSHACPHHTVCVGVRGGGGGNSPPRDSSTNAHTLASTRFTFYCACCLHSSTAVLLHCFFLFFTVVTPRWAGTKKVYTCVCAGSRTTQTLSHLETNPHSTQRVPHHPHTTPALSLSAKGGGGVGEVGGARLPDTLVGTKPKPQKEHRCLHGSACKGWRGGSTNSTPPTTTAGDGSGGALVSLPCRATEVTGKIMKSKKRVKDTERRGGEAHRACVRVHTSAAESPRSLSVQENNACLRGSGCVCVCHC